jgi:hypothetical protein
VNLVRRPGAPFVVTAPGGRVLVEGTDFEPVRDPGLGTHPYKGEYDVWHEPPTIRMKGAWPDGTPLRVSYHHGATVYEGQANICPSEPRTVELLEDQARRVHRAWGARGYMMSHDEIRVYNWCAACQARHLTAGQMLADNVRTCVRILHEVNPGGRIYTWSDMFDPNHNAVPGPYYLVRGSYEGAWEGLSPEVTLLQWNAGRKDRSLAFFAERGHPQIIAGYYDGPVDEVRGWLEAAGRVRGVTGVMYTTWRSNYADLEAFARLIAPR